MKKLILATLATSTFLFSFSQVSDHSLKGYNLKGNVTKIESKQYSYSLTQKAVTNSSVDSKEFNKDGLITKSTSEYLSFSGKYATQYNSTNGKVNSSVFESFDIETGKAKSSSKTTYEYKNGLLESVHNDPTSSYPYRTTYTYNSNKELIKENKTGKNDKITSKKVFSEYNGDNYKSEVTFYDSKTGEVSSSYAKEYENNEVKRSLYTNSKGVKVLTTNRRNEHGDIFKILKDGELDKEYKYEYDKYGNWTKKVSISKSSYSGKISYYFNFREITYGRKTTGSTEFGVDFAKKHSKLESYEVKAYESSSSSFSKILENPSHIKIMYVMKTEGSRFKVKTDEGNYLTGKVKAMKHTNKKDMIVYHPKSNTTAIMKDFSDEFTRLDNWMEATILSRTNSMFWSVDDKKNWYITDKGLAFDKYEKSKLKYSSSNPNDVILSIDGVATYKLENYKNAVAHKLYPLIEL